MLYSWYMNIQKATKWFGIVTLIIGVLGFISASIMPGNFLGIFSLNTIYNVLYILAGMLALFSTETLSASKRFLKIFGVIYLAIAIIEVIGHGVFFGLFPVSLGDIIFHIILAIFALYCGFAYQTPKPAIVL